MLIILLKIKPKLPRGSNVKVDNKSGIELFE
jgi:hypothetical protein